MVCLAASILGTIPHGQNLTISFVRTGKYLLKFSIKCRYDHFERSEFYLLIFVPYQAVAGHQFHQFNEMTLEQLLRVWWYINRLQVNTVRLLRPPAEGAWRVPALWPIVRPCRCYCRCLTLLTIKTFTVRNKCCYFRTDNGFACLKATIPLYRKGVFFCSDIRFLSRHVRRIWDDTLELYERLSKWLY